MNKQLFDADVDRRARVQRGEHPILTRLVALRVVMNHEFGAQFEAFDHELAMIETMITEALPPSGAPEDRNG